MAKQPKLPARTNPLAKRIGKRLKLVREARGLSIDRASAQLGISSGHYVYLETAVTLPNPALAKRIYGWAVGGITYEGAGKPTEGVLPVGVAFSWRNLKVVFPRPLYRSLRGAAQHMGLSMSALVVAFVERGLAHKAGYAQLKRASDVLRQGEAINLLQAVPELRDFLTAEMAECVEAGKNLTYYNVMERTKPTVEKLATLPEAHLRKDNEPIYTENLLGDEPTEEI